VSSLTTARDEHRHDDRLVGVAAIACADGNTAEETRAMMSVFHLISSARTIAT
jgi:hypothetical protein